MTASITALIRDAGPQGDGPLRIGFINSVRSWGGGEKWHVDTAAGLAARGHDVRLYCRSRVVADHAERAGAPYTRLPFLNDHDPLTILPLAAHFTQWKPHVLFLNGHRECWVGATAGVLAGVPARVYRLGITGFQDKRIKARWYPKLITHWVGVCEAAAEELRAFDWIRPEQIDVMHNGVDIDTFTPQGKSTLRDELGLADDVCLLGMVSRLSGMKGHVVLLEALQHVRKKTDAFHLVIAGTGRKEPDIRAAGEKFGLADKVSFLGFRLDIAQILRALDILAHPSVSTEGMPHSVLEAMACGTAVVASDVAGIADLVIDGATGLLVAPERPGLLAEKLLPLISNRARCVRLGQAGRERVLAHFTRDGALDTVEQYARCLAAAPAQVEDTLAQGDELFHNRDYDEALQHWTAVLRRDPRHPEARVNAYYTRRALDKGLRTRDRTLALDLAPDAPDAPRVSVIMPTWNRPDFLQRAIASVMTQTLRDWELIVVNDGGAAEAERVVRSFRDERIRYLDRDHAGLSAALNAGLTEARGRYVAFLDDDDEWAPRHLDITARYLDVHPAVAAVYTQMMRVDVEWRNGLFYKSNARPWGSARTTAPDFRTGTHAAINAVVLRRKCLGNTGGFDPNMTHAMDWDLWVRLTREHMMVPLPDVTGEVHMHGAAQMTRDVHGDNQAEINTLAFMNGLLPPAMDDAPHFAEAREEVYRGLRTVLRDHPTALHHINARYLALPEGQPYAFFYDLADRLRRYDTPRATRAALRAAMRCAPLEPKLYSRYLATLS